MGKRSNFDRVPRDYYPTPYEAVVPLKDHLYGGPFSYWEPCAGDGRLIRHLSVLAPRAQCIMATDVEPRDEGVDQLDLLAPFDLNPKMEKEIDVIITNPPWDRKLLHPMIEKLSAIAPTWLLFDADWMHTKQAASYMGYLSEVVSVGRVKWIEGSKMTGKENCCWYLFDRWGTLGKTVFYGRTFE